MRQSCCDVNLILQSLHLGIATLAPCRNDARNRYEPLFYLAGLEKKHQPKSFRAGWGRDAPLGWGVRADSGQGMEFAGHIGAVSGGLYMGNSKILAPAPFAFRLHEPRSKPHSPLRIAMQ